jgi:hypothetical protein
MSQRKPRGAIAAKSAWFAGLYLGSVLALAAAAEVLKLFFNLVLK